MLSLRKVYLKHLLSQSQRTTRSLYREIGCAPKMSQPPKKKLRQSTVLEGFRKQSSLENNSSAFCSRQSRDMSHTKQEIRQKTLAAAQSRHEKKSPDVTPVHITEFPDINLHSTDQEQTNDQEDKNASTSKNVSSAQDSDNEIIDSQESLFSKTEEKKEGFYDEESMEAALLEESEIHSNSLAQKLDDTPSKGTPIKELRKTPGCASKLDSLHASDRHTVMFDPKTINSTKPPSPFPHTYHDKWDSEHVKLPCSKENLYPSQKQDGEKEIRSRWELIEESLLNDINSTLDLENAIKSYNTRYADRWHFGALHSFFNESLEAEEAQQFFDNILPFMKKLALRLPQLCTQGIPLLKKQKEHAITLTQEQLACIVANAFFCTFPRRNAHGKGSEYSSYPDINFNRLFDGGTRSRTVKGDTQSIKEEKLKCIIHYFHRIKQNMPTGTVSFRRQVLRDVPDWQSCHDRLTKLHVTSTGTIEDCGEGMLQVDFANKFLGGGVLGYGCVQEEIRFLLCPEMLVSRLFTEVLEKNECLVMTGTERFSSYTGYASSFRWDSDYIDQTSRDEWGRLYTEVVAIDALVFHAYRQQFHKGYVFRELNKAYCGFMSPGVDVCNSSAVATGNWGCGAFGGDHRLKALIQLMSAAAAKREVCYFTFQDTKLRDELYDIHTFITKKNLAVSDLVAMIEMYERYLQKHSQKKQTLFEFIYQTYLDSDCDTDTTEEQHSPDYAADTP